MVPSGTPDIYVYIKKEFQYVLIIQTYNTSIVLIIFTTTRQQHIKDRERKVCKQQKADQTERRAEIREATLKIFDSLIVKDNKIK